MKFISLYLLVLLNNNSPVLAFPIQNLLWATSKADEAYDERALQPVREQHVFPNLQNQSGWGRWQYMPHGTCQQSFFTFCILAHTRLFWLPVLTLPVVKCMAIILYFFSLDSSLTVAFSCRSGAGPVVVLCQCWDESEATTCVLMWKEQKAAKYGVWA